METVKALQHSESCPHATRIFSGHMVWQPGALEAELAAGKWFPAMISPALMFSETGGELLWNEVWGLLKVWYEQHMGPKEVERALNADVREKAEELSTRRRRGPQ